MPRPSPEPAPEPRARASWLSLPFQAWAFQRDPLRFFESLERRYGDTVVFDVPRRGRRGGRPLVVSSSPELLRAALSDERLRNSSLTLGGPRGSSQRTLRQSLFRMHGEDHRRHRRLVGEMLAKRPVERSAPAMLRAIDAHLGRWTPGDERNLPHEMKAIARDIAASVLFGIDDLAEATQLGEQIEDWWRESFRLGPRVLRAPWMAPTRRMLAKAEALEARVRERIADKRAALRGADAPDDLFARLVEARDEHGGLSEGELVGHAHMLFLAAHETTAYALTWALLLLCLHPRSAGRVADEVARTLGENDPGADTLERCPELGNVIRESQRLLPVVPYGARIAEEDLELASLPLPRGSRLLLPFYRLHVDPREFPEPLRFRPERWRDRPPSPWTYLPFSAGPHMCIGMRFAMQTQALVLARVLQRFRLEVAPGTRVDRRVTVTLSPRGPIPVRLDVAGAKWSESYIDGNLRELVDLSHDR